MLPYSKNNAQAYQGGGVEIKNEIQNFKFVKKTGNHVTDRKLIIYCKPKVTTVSN